MHVNRMIPRLVLPALALLVAGAAHARHPFEYEVTITNITKGQSFTPQLVATHHPSVALFELGTAASSGIELLAEAGDTSGAAGELLAHGHRVGDVQTIAGLLGPGQSVSTVVAGSIHHRYLSVAAMLIPTNDTFVALNGVRLPLRGERAVTALAYDAGTEFNDQNCSNIPGPRCNGEGLSPGPNEDDEGYVYVSNGFHDIAGESSGEGEVLGPFTYDWRNPVARVVITRVK
jgi:hypothetical protein